MELLSPSLQACASGGWSPTPDLAWRLIAVTGLLLIAGWAAGQRFFPGQRVFCALQIAMVAWLLASGIERASASAVCKFTWALISWPAIMAVPALWTLFLYQYVGSRLPPTPWRWRAVVLVPVGLMALIAWSNPQHGLLYGPATALAANGLRLRFDYGPAFFVAAAYNYACLIGGLGLAALAARRAAPPVRTHLLGFVAIACIPWVANIAYLGGGVTIDGADPTPLAFGIGAAGFAWLVSRHRLFAVVPVARRLLWSELPDPLLILDRERRVVDANPAALTLAGATPPWRSQSLADWPGFGAPLAAHLDNPTRGPLLRLPALGRAFDVRKRPLGPPDAPIGELLQLRDATEQQRAQERIIEVLAQRNAQLQKVSSLQAELRDQALRDPLTGLHNRRALTDEFATLRADPSQPLALGLIDIDHFKRINDQHGHSAGDEVLCSLADAMGAGIRATDRLYRIGGEEFVLLMPGADATVAVRRLDGLRQTIERQPLMAAGSALTISFSAGVAGAPDSGSTLDDLLLAADRALYDAKSQGRGRVVLAKPAV